MSVSCACALRGVGRHAARRFVQRHGIASTPTPAGTAAGDPPASAWGWCARCETVHSVPRTPRAEAEARALLERIRREACFDFEAPSRDARFALSTKYPSAANPGAQGQMIGLLVAEAGSGEVVVLRAFSGQMNGAWRVPGWCPPVGTLTSEHPVYAAAQRRIVALGREAAQLRPQSARGGGGGAAERATAAAAQAAYARAREAQREVSRALLARIRDAYTLGDFSGRSARLADAVLPGTPLVGGMADCAAPKLLAAAQQLRLRPLGMAELWCGAPPPSGGRVEGLFYTACEERCQPLLGFMLCGA